VALLLAACIHNRGKAPAASAQYTLAVFPWILIDGPDDGGGSPFEITMSAFQDVLATSAFMPVASYYDLHEGATPIKEMPRLDNVWTGQGLSSEPNHKIVFQLGQQLGVDAIIMYFVAKLHENDQIQVYLFDIPAQRIYSAQGNSRWFVHHASRAVSAATIIVFKKFLRKRV
jgi:hypothetical protein